MSLLNSIGNVGSVLTGRPPAVSQPDLAQSLSKIGKPETTSAPQAGGFGNIFENIISAVDAKDKQADAVTNKVLLGDSDQLHQSMIAMQEASVSFNLMVQVRNKVVESYQELMRMPV
ncbi:MAG TPA: flagellar hook-basal body complex protein FliE [Opitutaceae bacterium]|nr:flagellar hook-basal body complex protein FliE [Opitutaceae bacterium]